jgi:hypothetical protein
MMKERKKRDIRVNLGSSEAVDFCTLTGHGGKRAVRIAYSRYFSSAPTGTTPRGINELRLDGTDAVEVNDGEIDCFKSGGGDAAVASIDCF